mmetsp:Transcript_25616/g.59666  ORF Transcript_25616/g.59666 Transcript_25616/m.59666 type:complete len:217 (+) Transcript_25616:560-1210(+)
MAMIEPSLTPATRSHSSTKTCPRPRGSSSARRTCSGSCCRKLSTRSRPPFPAAHIVRPQGTVCVPSFVCTAMLSAVTLLTCVPVRTSMPCEVRALYASSCKSGPNIGSKALPRCTKTILTYWTRFGCSFCKSFLTKSLNSPQNSHPVGPPPTVTKVRSFLFSSSDVPGKSASSKHSVTRRRIRRASWICFRKKQCSSTPGTPIEEVFVPMATTSAS